VSGLAQNRTSPINLVSQNVHLTSTIIIVAVAYGWNNRACSEVTSHLLLACVHCFRWHETFYTLVTGVLWRLFRI